MHHHHVYSFISTDSTRWINYRQIPRRFRDAAYENNVRASSVARSVCRNIAFGFGGEECFRGVLTRC